MPLQVLFVLVVLVVMVVLFLTEKLPIEVTAMLGLAVLIFSGFVAPDEAFSGFASPAVITMLMVFILSAGLQQTGVADWLAARLQALAGGREELLLLVIMFTGGGLSAFMNNVAATAVLLPAVAGVARRSGLPPSRLFLPLSFGAILGGTTTLVGTPPNLLTAEVLLQHGLEPFRLFDFTPLGVALLLLGVLFMLIVGRRMLPDRGTGDGPSRAAEELSKAYGLEERLFTLRVPQGSPLDGLTLSQARFGAALNVQVVTLLRGRDRVLAPGPQEKIHGGDLLLVTGRLADLTELLRVQRVEVHEAGIVRLQDASGRIDAVRLRLLEGSDLTGSTLADSRFRERFGLVVAEVRRHDEALVGGLARRRLAVGDELLALGTEPATGEIHKFPDFEVVQSGGEALAHLASSLFLVSVLEDSPLIGRSLVESRIGELAGLTIVAVLRDTESLAVPRAEDVFAEGDRLLVAGEPGHMEALLRMAGIDVESKGPTPILESEEVGVVEVIVAPRSGVAGRSLQELAFRDRYGLQVLAIWRQQGRLRSGFARHVLALGDALLLQGPWAKIRRLAQDPDFVVLAETLPVSRRTAKAPFALGALLLMVGLVVSRLYPIQVAAFVAAVVILLSRALTPQEAYRAVEWRAIFLVAALLPAGMAMESSGAALYLAQTLAGLAEQWGPHATLAVLVVLSSLLSQGLDGAPTVVLLAPVVFHSAQELGLSPYPLFMGVGLAASAAFMTPFSHKANLLVMSAGGYRTVDFLRVGTPLTVIVLAVVVVLVPVFFPF